MPHRNKPPFEVAVKGERQKLSIPKNKRWTHHDDLEELKGKFVDLEFMNGKTGTHELIDYDQFTLKVYGDVKRTVITTYYKHSIAGYQPSKTTSAVPKS